MPDAPSSLYIGLMSGTSMDAIDAALVDLSTQHPRLLASASSPIDHELRNALLALCEPGDNEIERLGRLDYELGECFAALALEVLAMAGVQAGAVCAIGSHGQTIRHVPAGPAPFSLQIASPSIIAQRTGITTVADFRSRDIAAGGQGAPLVPAFHAAVFRVPEQHRCILNIGGIANLTLLPAESKHPITGFDTGPGNVLMNAWCQRNLAKPYDQGGQWAAGGQPDQALLAALLDDDYFRRPPPKSTGRELFNQKWLDERLGASTLPAADIQATLCELTAASIQQAIDRHATDTAQVLVCGGGAYNTHLMRRLGARLHPIEVQSTEGFGIAPTWVEAMAFAWLAKQTLEKRPGNVPAVTGASAPVILGGIYPG